MTREITKKIHPNTKSKILVLGLILVVLVGIFSPTDKVSSQTTSGQCWKVIPGPPVALPTTLSKERCSQANVKNNDGTWQYFAEWREGTPVKTATELQSDANSTPDNSCGLTNLPACGLVLLRVIASFILKLAAFILWLAGMILNFVLNETVVKMTENLGKFTGINIAWKIVRDMLNVAFIFLLVYQGIKVILGLIDIGKVKGFISMVVLASLLVNFSLFFTKVLIDASNVVTVSIYNSLIDSSSTADPTATGKPLSGLSVPFMNAMGLTDFYSVNSLSADKVGGEGNLTIFFLMGAVIFIITAFVFFAVACLFVIRYITLIVLLMLSPVAYMGMALPQIKEHTNDWWNSLTGQLLFAPIYMIMTSVILTLMTAKGFLTTDNKGFANLMDGNSSTANGPLGLILNFAVIIGLIIATLLISKKAATQGSKLIGQGTGKLTAFAGGAVMGGAAGLGRNAFGRAGSIISKSDKVKDWATSDSAITRFAGKTLLKTGDKASKSSFDIRGTNRFQSLAKQADVDFGKAQKTTFVKKLEDKTKAETDYAKLLKPEDEEEAKKKALAKFRATSPESKKLKENEDKTKAEADQATKELDEMKKKEEEIKKRQKNATIVDKSAIEKELKEMQEGIKRKEEDVQKLKKANEDAIASTKKAEDEVGKVWQNRVIAYAKIVEENSVKKYATEFAKKLAKYAGGAGAASAAGAIWGEVGLGTGALAAGAGVLAGAGVGIGAMAHEAITTHDRRQVGKSLKKLVKAKTPEQKVMDALKEAEDAKQKEKPKDEEGGKEEPKKEGEGDESKK